MKESTIVKILSLAFFIASVKTPILLVAGITILLYSFFTDKLISKSGKEEVEAKLNNEIEKLRNELVEHKAQTETIKSSVNALKLQNGLKVR